MQKGEKEQQSYRNKKMQHKGQLKSKNGGKKKQIVAMAKELN